MSNRNITIKKQRDEMLEMLQEFVETHEGIGVINTEYYVKEFKQLIKQATEL